jgi:hypothetical protein
VTADSPLRQRIFISLSSASVSVLDFLGGIVKLLILLAYYLISLPVTFL